MTELCGELWLETGSPFLNTSDNTTQSAVAASDLNAELGMTSDELQAPRFFDGKVDTPDFNDKVRRDEHEHEY